MAISILGHTSVGKKPGTGSSLTVNCPSDAVAPVGSYLVVGISVRSRDDASGTHTISTPSGWELLGSGNEAASGVDYKQLWVFGKTKATGDAAWSFASTGQEPTRMAACIALAGFDSADAVIEATENGSTSNVSTHSAPAVTINTVGNWRLIFTTDNFDTELDGSLPAGTTHYDSWARSGSSGIGFEADLGVLYAQAAGTGSTGTASYDVLQVGGDDYQAITLEIAVGASAQTMVGTTFGSVAMPLVGGLPRITTGDAGDTAATELADNLRNKIALLVDLSPRSGDGAGDEAAEIKVSQGYAGSAYRSIVQGVPTITQSISSGDGMGGGIASSVGSIAIQSERHRAPDSDPSVEVYDGEFDSWLSEYVWDQRPATLAFEARRRTDETVVAGPITVAECRTRQANGQGVSGIEIELTDLNERLVDRKAQSVVLAGTGDSEGGAELKGARAPLCIGYCYNVPGVVIDKANNRYLLHRDSAGNSLIEVTAVYIGSNEIDSADYTVTLGASNEVEIDGVDLDDSKRVTFDVVGPGGSTVASMAEYLLTDIGPLEASDLDSDRFDLFAERYPFRSGWYVSGDETIADLLNAWTRPIAYWGPNSSGLIDLGLLIDPSLDFGDYTLPRSAIRGVRPVSADPPAKIITTGYRKNFTQVDESGVSAIARATERGRWATLPHYRIAAEESESLGEIFPSSRTPQDFVLPLVDADEAAIVHAWIAAVQMVPWKVYEIRCDLRAARYEVGRVVTFSFPRYGLSTAVQARILRKTINGRRDVTLLVFRLSGFAAIGADGGPLAFISTEDGSLIEA